MCIRDSLVLKLSSATLTIKPMQLRNAKQVEEEEKLSALFAKHRIRSGNNLRVSESPKGRRTTEPGVETEISVTLTNRATQARELLSIDWPPHLGRIFLLKHPLPSPSRPVRIKPGGTYTQSIKFKSAPSQSGIFRLQLLFNFSSWVLELSLIHL